MNEAARLAVIRDRLGQIAPGEWTRVHDAEGCFVEARGPMGELNEVLRFHPGASEAEMTFATEAPQTVRFLLGLVDRAIARLRPALRQAQDDEGEAAGRAKDFAAEAAMKCQEPAFKAFLEQRHGLERPLTDERTAQKLRSLLGITTRAALNSDAAAASLWKKLRGDFEAWRREPG